MTYLNEEKPTPEEVLMHIGVKGMKWGHRKQQDAGVNKLPSNRQLNKASRARDKAARNAAIDAARTRYANSARQNYLDAKAQYQIDKKTMGTREAKKKFNAVKEQNTNDYEVANMAKSGKETTVAVLGLVGTVAISALFNVAAHR